MLPCTALPFVLLAALAGSTQAAFHQPLARRSVAAHNNPKLAVAMAELAVQRTTTSSSASQTDCTSSSTSAASASATASKCAITTRNKTKSIKNRVQQTATATSSASASASTSSSAAAAASSSSSSVPDFYIGANSYFLHALPEDSRHQVLDAMVEANMKVLRIFVSYTYENNKGSGSTNMPDLESEEVGSYDDTILEAIDQLMVECKERGLKLMIALHDRYSLGWWSIDAYARKFNIVDDTDTGSPEKHDASNFYEQDAAKLAFDKRIDHILAHKNTLMDNRKWSELDDVIYALEPENEPMGHMNYIGTWICDRAGRIKENLPSDSGILISTGGGITLDTSLNEWAQWTCDAVNIVSAHDYGTIVENSISALQAGMDKANQYGKKLVFGEYGASGSSKAAIITDFVNALNDAQIPHMIWELLKPGAGEGDYEIWTDEASWKAFVPDSSSKRMLKRMLKRTLSSSRTHSKRSPLAQPRNLQSRQIRQPHNATETLIGHTGDVLRARSMAEFAKLY